MPMWEKRRIFFRCFSGTLGHRYRGVGVYSWRHGDDMVIDGYIYLALAQAWLSIVGVFLAGRPDHCAEGGGLLRAGFPGLLSCPYISLSSSSPGFFYPAGGASHPRHCIPYRHGTGRGRRGPTVAVAVADLVASGWCPGWGCPS
jgi:hypothetical protein